MTEVFTSVLKASLNASLAGIVILLIKRILKNKLSPRWHYLIWFVLIIKLLIPFGPPSPVSFFNTVYSKSYSIDFIQPEFNHNQQPSLISGETPSKSVQLPVDNQDNIDENVNNASFKKISTIASYIWIAVFILSLLFVIFINVNFNKKLKINGRPVPLTLKKILNDCKERIKYNGGVDVIIQDIIKVPSVVGFLSPKILITPTVLVQKEERISYIFLHELSHLKRKDILVNYLLIFLQLFYWFNPLIWYYFKKIRQDMETATDEEVLVLLENSERKEYGKTLISILESFNMPAPSLKLVSMVDDRENIESRIRMISMAEIFKTKRVVFFITGILCFVFVGIFLLTGPVSKNEVQVGSLVFDIPGDIKINTDTSGLIIEKNTIFKYFSTTRIISYGGLAFEKEKLPIGGIQIISYEPGQPLFLPNHSEVKSQKEIKGLNTKAVLVNLDLSQPAASGDNSVKNENHLYLIFEEEKIAYDIYADSRYADEALLLKIAKSFKPADNAEVIKVIQGFGKRLKDVSKLAPVEILRESINQSYGEFIAPGLLNEWIKDPTKAPGRYVSSPWPDRIDIKDIVKESESKYTVFGEIVEITSVPGEEWRTKIIATVEKIEGKWLITGIEAQEYKNNAEDDKQIILNALENAKFARLAAVDAQKEIMLSEEQRNDLKDAFLMSKAKIDEEYPGGALVSEFPDYQLQLDDIHIYFINKNQFAVSGKTFSVYNTGGEIWEALTKILPVGWIDDKEVISYLFNAQRVEVASSKDKLIEGDYTARKNHFVRILRDGKLKGNGIGTGTRPEMIVKFYVNGDAIDVEIYEDGFKYQRNYYYKPGLGREIKNMLSAG